MSIYTHTATDRTPYTYLIGWSKHNIWYYGKRSKVGCHPSEFWKKYFTSSKHVKLFREKHGDPDIIQIRKTFNTIEDARLWETKVLTRINAAHDDRFLNKRNGDLSNNFNTHNMLLAKLASTGEYLGNIIKTDPRWASGEIIFFHKNTLCSEEHKEKQRIAQRGKIIAKNSLGETFVVYKDDPRWISGELMGIKKNMPGPNIGKHFDGSHSKGTATAKTKDGIKLGRVSLLDPRWKTGEIVGVLTGTKPKINKTPCPYCEILLDPGNFKRHVNTHL